MQYHCNDTSCSLWLINELDKLWQNVIEYHVNKDKVLHHSSFQYATIATSRFEEFAKVESLFTFGSPRAGTRSFVKNIKTPHFRFVNNNDIVTSVPPAFMFYRHHGDLTYINHYGNIRKLTLWQRIKDKWRGRWRAFQKRQPFDGAYDHGMGYYVKHIEKNK